jgi:hypothetical protein
VKNPVFEYRRQTITVFGGWGGGPAGASEREGCFGRLSAKMRLPMQKLVLASAVFGALLLAFFNGWAQQPQGGQKPEGY